MLNIRLLISALLIFITAISISVKVYAEKNGFSFNPISSSANSDNWNPSSPWIIPEGFTQTKVSDETDLNIYDRGRDDWNDMNTVNESGKQAGRFLYRAHELRYPLNQPEGGTISVVDLATGAASVLVQDASYNALDGIRWSPWGSLVFAEESDGGRLLEIELNENLMSAKAVHDRLPVGRLAHEGIDFDANGNVYVIDEHRGVSSGCFGLSPCGGGIYKFAAETYGDLSSGSLYVLKVTGTGGTGQGEWVGPIDPSNARKAGTLAGGQSYQRPEDIEIVNGVLYVAITEGLRDIFGREMYEGRVISVDLNSLKVSDFVKPGLNVGVETGQPGDSGFQTGFDSVDNLAEAPSGDLVMIEDNSPSDIWFASTKVDATGASTQVKLFASLTDPEAEGTGIYFSPKDPETLYVNVQHSAAEDGDATWAITKKGHNHWKKTDK